MWKTELVGFKVCVCGMYFCAAWSIKSLAQHHANVKDYSNISKETFIIIFNDESSWAAFCENRDQF